MSVARQMVVVAGLLSVPVVTTVDPGLPGPIRDPGPQADSRLLKLTKFFAAGKCPLRSASADFLEAADRYDLDWRLLPSISVVEAGGGKVFRNNNVLVENPVPVTEFLAGRPPRKLKQRPTWPMSTAWRRIARPS